GLTGRGRESAGARMTEEDALLSAISAGPEDATLRGVYADWLEERGDPRADYLRLLAALERAEADGPPEAELLTQLHEAQRRHRIDRRWVVRMCRGRITRALRAVQSGAPEGHWLSHERYQALACRCGALPVWADMGGILLLTPDGEVLTLGDDEVLRTE